MISRTTARIASTFALAAFLAVPAFAQRNAPHNGAEESPVLTQMKNEAGQMAIGYWQPKLNEYKVRIDRILSPADLADLNRMRVRFALLVSEAIKENKNDVREERVERGEGTSVTIKADLADPQEFMTLYLAAKEMAERYRTQMNSVGETVVGDVTGFIGEMKDFAEAFETKNQAAIAADPAAAQILSNKEAHAELDELKTEEGQQGLKMVYSFAIEPIILLYNGSDLRELISQMGGGFNATSGVGGLNLPASSVLAQNFPNPAQNNTTIGYNISEPSSKTTIRIFDAKGTVVKTIDEGSRPAGEHEVRVDLTGLPSGAYLYQLTISTSKGEQVFSKGMQIVR